MTALTTGNLFEAHSYELVACRILVTAAL